MDTTLLHDSEYHTPVLNLENRANEEKIKSLTKGFLPTKRTLLEVSQIFTDEIELGLAQSPSKKSSLIMANTFITKPPDGKERGKFMSLDLGSSNFRVVLSEYNPDGTNEFHLKHYTVPVKFRRGDSKPLFYFFAECIKDFVDTFLPDCEEEISMGFTFSFPMTQKAINVAILETWTKDFDCPNAVGKDAAQLLQEAIDEHKGLKVKLVATLNDTTGTLVQGLYYDPTCAIGLIIGTGSNACYIEKIENVNYWTDRDEWIKEGYEWVIIDMECGGFGDNRIIDFAKTEFDQSLDKESLFPHSYTFEKLLGGKFLGDIIRRVLLHLTEKNLVFNGKVTKELKTFEIITAHDLSAVESFYSDEDDNIYKSLATRLGFKSFSADDKEVVRYVCAIVSVRAALMLATILSNLIIRIDRPEVTIAVDGSVYKYHPKLHKLMTDFIHELVPENKKFKMILAEDGSGKGAGLVAAIATKLKH